MKKLTEELKPNKNVATESANVAHEFLACFQKMEFPDNLIKQKIQNNNIIYTPIFFNLISSAKYNGNY